jgi:hypothetical protein
MSNDRLGAGRLWTNSGSGQDAVSQPVRTGPFASLHDFDGLSRHLVESLFDGWLGDAPQKASSGPTLAGGATADPARLAARARRRCAPYSSRVQQRHRLRTTTADFQRPLSGANEAERPWRREFASRGSGVQIPSAPPRNGRSETYCLFLGLSFPDACPILGAIWEPILSEGAGCWVNRASRTGTTERGAS